MINTFTTKGLMPSILNKLYTNVVGSSMESDIPYIVADGDVVSLANGVTYDTQYIDLQRSDREGTHYGSPDILMEMMNTAPLGSYIHFDGVVFRKVAKGKGDVWNRVQGITPENWFQKNYLAQPTSFKLGDKVKFKEEICDSPSYRKYYGEYKGHAFVVCVVPDDGSDHFAVKCTSGLLDKNGGPLVVGTSDSYIEPV